MQKARLYSLIILGIFNLCGIDGHADADVLDEDIPRHTCELEGDEEVANGARQILDLNDINHPKPFDRDEEIDDSENDTPEYDGSEGDEDIASLTVIILTSRIGIKSGEAVFYLFGSAHFHGDPVDELMENDIDYHENDNCKKANKVGHKTAAHIEQGGDGYHKVHGYGENDTNKKGGAVEQECHFGSFLKIDLIDLPVIFGKRVNCFHSLSPWEAYLGRARGTTLPQAIIPPDNILVK